MSTTVISGRGEEPHRGPPRSRAPAHVQDPAPGDGVVPPEERVDQPGEETERKDLPVVGMPRELQVEFPPRGRVQLRAVLEEEREPSVRAIPQEGGLGGPAGSAEPCAGGIVDARDAHRVVDRHGFVPKEREARPPGEGDRTVDPRVIFVVPEDRDLPARRGDPPQDLRQLLDAVQLPVHEVPRRHEDVRTFPGDERRDLPGLADPVDEAEVEVGDLRDPQRGDGRREPVRDDAHPDDFDAGRFDDRVRRQRDGEPGDAEKRGASRELPRRVRGDPAAPHRPQGKAEEVDGEVQAGEEEEEPHPEVAGVRDDPCRDLVAVAAQQPRCDRREQEKGQEQEKRERRPGTEGQRRFRPEKGVGVHGTVDQEERKEEQAHGGCAIIDGYEDRP